MNYFIYKNGFLLGLVTIILFLCTYYFFLNSNYYKISICINAFVLPSLYIGFILFFIFQFRKKGITFKQIFYFSFGTLIFGGTLSLLFIFIFLNFIDPEAKNLLLQQHINIKLQNALAIEETKQREAIEKMLKSNATNFFSLQWFFYIISGLYFCYLIISLYLAKMLKNKTSE